MFFNDPVVQRDEADMDIRAAAWQNCDLKIKLAALLETHFPHRLLHETRFLLRTRLQIAVSVFQRVAYPIFVTLALGLLTLSCAPKDQPSSVLIITLDTVRADRLGAYGKEDAGTPNLDQFSSHAHVFENAFSVAPVTTPSHASIMTGTYPPFHGVRDNGFFKLPDHAVTLAEVLADHGYATGAAVGSYPLNRRFNLNQGFSFYDDRTRQSQDERTHNPFFDERPAFKVNEAFLPWLNERVHEPFFAWVHYWDAHQPLQPPPPFRDHFQHDKYQGEISYVDYAIGQVFELLKQEDEYENTIIIVLADHGEGLGQHGEHTHALLAYNSTLHVPLIIKDRNQKQGHRIKSWVSTVDVMPTVLDLLEFPPMSALQGHSRVPLMHDRESTPITSSSLYAEGMSGRISHDWGELRVLFVPPYKLIYGPRPELFKLDSDPLELHDLSSDQPDQREKMTRRLASLAQELDSPDDDAGSLGDLDPEVFARLASLGYTSAPREQNDLRVNESLKSDGPAPQDMVGNNTLESLYLEYWSEGRFLDSLSPAKKLYEVHPSPKSASMLASTYFQLGRLESAIALVENTATWSPYFSLALLTGSIRASSQLGSHDRALQLAQRLIREIPSADAHVEMALAIKQSTIGSDYRSHLEQALKLDATHSGALFELAVLEMAQGQTEHAMSRFKQLMNQEPYLARHPCNLGLALLDQGQLERAQEMFDRSLFLDETYANAYLGSLAIAVKQKDQAAIDHYYQKAMVYCQQATCIEKAQSLLIMDP